MVELKGSLSGIGLPAIVQLIGELHHSGSLELTKAENKGVLGFDAGRLVVARFADESGLPALVACSKELADADFTFVEGPVTGERSLDLGSTELKGYFAQLRSGDGILEPPPPPAPAVVPETVEVGPCPYLGFADDASRHYSRPTALHRCYVDGSPDLVSGQEQREYCLAGRYPACPRFRNSAIAPVEPRSTVPAGVSARLAAAAQLRVAQGQTEDEVPTWIGEEQPEPLGRRAPPRRLVLIGGVVVLGLAVAVFAGLPALDAALRPVRTNVQSAPAVARAPTISATANPTATTAGVAPTATQPPVAAPTPTTLTRPATPTTAPGPTTAALAASAGPLLDVRFSAGPPADWIENPPYASWSNGAYRLQARQPERFVAVGAPVARLLGDVRVSATFHKTGGPPGGGYGLILRDQGPEPRDGINQAMNAYVLEAGDLGEFGVWRRDGDRWIDLVPWTQSPSVRSGGSPNALEARVVGGRFVFTVNGADVATVDDATLAAGGVGVFVGGDFNEVAVDQFTVEVLN
jgi:Domain of unknown function (DUF4388)